VKSHVVPVKTVSRPEWIEEFNRESREADERQRQEEARAAQEAAMFAEEARLVEEERIVAEDAARVQAAQLIAQDAAAKAEEPRRVMDWVSRNKRS
jgi:hypothetical protein